MAVGHPHFRYLLQHGSAKGLTSVHCSQHTGDELVDTKAFFHQRYERRDSTLVGVGSAEGVEDELLE